MIHLVQLGSTMEIYTQKSKEEELDLLENAFNKESRIRREKTKEQLKKINTEQTKFLTKCEDLAKKIITILEGADTDNPLEKTYHFFEGVVSKLQ